MASTRTNAGTQAPLATKLSAEAAWRESSRAIRRTKTLVSIARITFSCVGTDAFFELSRASGFRLPRPEQGVVNLFRTEAPCTPDDDPIALFSPLDDGTGPDPQFFT